MTDATKHNGGLEEVGTTSRGYTIFREVNEVGGHRYWSDEIGGGVMVWDTCLADSETLRRCLEIEAAHAREAGAQEPVAVPAGWTLADLHRANAAREEEWCPDQKPDLSFRGNELAGEIGEACNVIKKLERERHGWAGSRDTVEHLAEELADGIMCIDLAANAAGISGEALMTAVVKKFNAVSEARGFKTMLAGALVSPPAEGGDDDVLEVLKDVLAVLRKEAPGTKLNNHRFAQLGIRANNVVANAEARRRSRKAASPVAPTEQKEARHDDK